MRHLIPAISLLFTVSTLHVRADEDLKHPVKPLLWKITGGDLKKPSYLFGTIHLGGGPLNQLHPAAETAYREAESVYTEIPMDAKTQLSLTAGVMRRDGKTLSQSIGAGLTTALDEELKGINPAFHFRLFEPMKTWAIAVSLPMLEAQLLGATAMDKMIWERAVKDRKKTAGMETASFQMGLFNQLSEEEQVSFLSETLRIMREDRKAGKNSVKDLTNAYIQGDAELIKQLVDQSIEDMRNGPQKELGEKIFNDLLTKRDATMAATIAKHLNASPATIHFFAAGTAHFIGEKSIRSHLEKAGYEITRVGNEGDEDMAHRRDKRAAEKP